MTINLYIIPELAMLNGTCRYNLRVLSNYGTVCPRRLAGLCALGGDHLLAVLGHDSVHYGVSLGVALLAGVLNLRSMGIKSRKGYNLLFVEDVRLSY